MTHSRQHSLFAALFENTPSILFLTLLNWSGDLRIAGWSGSTIAALVCTAYLLRKLQPHTILLGINLYILLVTPSVEVLILLGMKSIAAMWIANSQSFVLIAIFLTGIALTAVSKDGFLGAPGKHRKDVTYYSLVLLVVSFLTVVWAFLVDANRLVEIGVPLLLLFGVRQFLIARFEDREDQQTGGHMTIPVAIGSQSKDLDLGA